ncbi:MAG: nuclease-related domain-containing protein, partial [Candidatus Limnocylindrales bacterium]
MTTGPGWRVRYDGVCAKCGIPLAKGTPAVWDRASRTIRCIECPAPQPLQPPLPPNGPRPIDPGIPGGSARAKHDQLEARREASITDHWGTGFAAKVVRAVSEEPRTTRVWAIGAEGEEHLAAELATVPNLLMLHDRKIPGTQANIDHIVIGPGGLFVVDAKNHAGRIEIRDRGGLFRPDHRLVVGRRDQTSLADGVLWQAGLVEAVLADRQLMPPPRVVPVLCFLRAEWPLLFPPDTFRGVRLEGPRSLKRLVSAPVVLNEPQGQFLLALLAE